MPSQTEIANQAYAHLGQGIFIGSLTEQSAEAKLANLFYLPAVKATLRDFNWPFATRIITAQLIEVQPNSEWGYSYRYPSDCLNIRRFLSGTRNDTNDSKIAYRIIGDDAGQVILTDAGKAQLEYTCFIKNAGNFPPDFELAMSYRWASYLVPKITGGDPLKIFDRIMSSYRTHIGIAKVNAGNEQQNEPQPDSSYALSRS